MKTQSFRNVGTISILTLLISSLFVISNSSGSLASSAGSDEVSAASGTNRFVVWYDDTPGNYDIFIRRSTDNGATWQPKVNLSNNPGSSSFPQMAVAGSRVYVVWTQYNAAGTLADVFFRRSTDNGVTWQSIKNISGNAGYSAIEKLAISGSNVYVVWSDQTPGNYDILFRRSTDNGATWEPTETLSNNIGVSNDSQIAVSGSNVYVAWSDYAPGNADIFSRRSTDGGALWKPGQNLSNNSGNSVDPQLAS